MESNDNLSLSQTDEEKQLAYGLEITKEDSLTSEEKTTLQAILKLG